MNEPPSVRSASFGDVEQLSSMGSKAFLHAYGNTAAESDIERHVDAHFGIAAIYAEMQRPGVQYFMATTSNGCVGLLKLRDKTAPVEIDGENVLEIQQLYVSSDHQRKGVGVLLMDCAVQVAKDRGADGVWLSVWSEAKWATAFYRRYGFTEIGTALFHIYATKYVDNILWLPTPPD
jgi:ribosomal protein S18 acetylase RimI-like enzyme